MNYILQILSKYRKFTHKIDNIQIDTSLQGWILIATICSIFIVIIGSIVYGFISTFALMFDSSSLGLVFGLLLTIIMTHYACPINWPKNINKAVNNFDKKK